MSKYTVTGSDGDWHIQRGGRTKARVRSDSARDKWLSAHCSQGDRIFIEEEDGYLNEITRSVLK